MNNKDKTEFILTLSCPDTSGIVAEVAGFMADQKLTIKESNQFGDSETDSFFMRVKALSISDKDNIDINDIKKDFEVIAQKRQMQFNVYNTSIKPKIIIMFGAEVTKLLTNTEDSIFKSRGKWYNIKIKENLESVLAISMFHPRYVLVNPESKKETWKDLKEVRKKLLD